MGMPNWNDFIGVNSGDLQNAFEALARFLFKEEYKLTDNLAYFKNNTGNETKTITNGNEVIGFQAKYFEHEINTKDLIDSMEKAKEANPDQTTYVVYTNMAFGNPPKGKKHTKKEEVMKTASALGMKIEWWFGDNILDAVAKNPLLYDLFFNPNSGIRNIHSHISRSNELYINQISDVLHINGQSYSFNRSNLCFNLNEHVKQGKSVLIYGESGSGKSALVRRFFEDMKKDENDFAFYIINASQLDTNIVNDVFDLQESYTIVDFCRFYNNCGTKVFVIDSAEKLLTNEKGLTLTLLIDELRNNGWSVLFTCRQNAQADLFEVLSNQHNMIMEMLEVPLITDDELTSFAQKFKTGLPSDLKLRERLLNLFFLSRYCELKPSNHPGLTLMSFRENIWNKKIRGGGYGAAGQDREQCLLDIVTYQIENNTYYVPKKGVNSNAAYALITDEVLVDNGLKGYSFKHDIYDDWAAEFWMEQKYQESNNDVTAFISKVGETLHGVNAFARWLETQISENGIKAIEILADKLVKGDLSDIWGQAVIKTICCSDECACDFFNKYRQELMDKDFYWLNKLIDTMSVSCQIIDRFISFEDEVYPILKPIGGGWGAVINFVYDIKDTYCDKNMARVYKILDDYRKIKDANFKVMEKAAKLSLRLFDYIADERKEGKWINMENADRFCEILCDYAYAIPEEIRKRGEDVVKHKWGSPNDPYYELTTFIAKSDYNQIAHIVGLATTNLDLLLSLLGMFWFYNNHGSNNNHLNDRFGLSERDFGLNENSLLKSAYFPTSALQTPILLLLRIEQFSLNHEHKVLDFVLSVVNKAIEAYEKKPHKSDEIYYVNVGLPSGGEKKVISSENLWNIYRGTSRIPIPYLIQSIHMALEKYLLDLMEENGNIETVRAYLHSILEQADTCSLVAVVASVVTAFPDEFYEEFLLLMQDIRILNMDLNRCALEITSGEYGFAYNRNQKMLEERKKAREMRHRKIHLEELLTYCQIIYDSNKSDPNAALRMQKLEEIVDNMKNQVHSMSQSEREQFDYIILRIDYKHMKKEPVQLDNGVESFRFVPQFPEEKKDDSQKSSTQFEVLLRSLNFRRWIENKYKGNMNKIRDLPYENDIQLVFNEIKEIQDCLAKAPKNFIFVAGDEFLPSMACGLVLTHYLNQLSEEQKNLCHNVLIDALSCEDFMLSSPLSGFEICIDALPVLIDLYPKEGGPLTDLIIKYAGIRHETGNYRACDKVRESISKSRLWENHHDLMKTAVDNYVRVAKDQYDGITDQAMADTVLSLIPSGTQDDYLRKHAIKCMQQLSLLWKNHDAFASDNTFFVAYTVADYILNANKEDIGELATPFVPFLHPEDNDSSFINAFIVTCCQYDKYENFWLVWDVFYEAMGKQSPSRYFAQTLNSYLLNPSLIGVTLNNDWFKFEESVIRFYRKVAKDIGDHPAVLCAVVNAFTSFAQNHVEESIPIIYDIIQKDPYLREDTMKVVNFHLEKIMSKLFTTISEKLHSCSILKDEITQILNFMKREGSKMASQCLSTF